jgi:hypothetical protein
VSYDAGEYRELCEDVEEAFRTTARREGRSYRVTCPRCVSSKTGRADYSMSLEPDGRFYCHRCASGGKLRNAPEPGASVPALQEAPRDVEPPEGYVPLGYEPGASAESLADARAYAARRGLPLDRCRILQVGACLSGYYAGRIVVPVLGDEGEWLGYVTRDWTGRAAKPYLYGRGLVRDRFWNHTAVADAEAEEPLLVVEGVLDATHYWPDAVAMLGKLTTGQLNALSATVRPVALVFDGDAWREARAYAMELRGLHGRRAGWVRLPPRTDPDEVDHGWLREQARACLEQPL